MILFDGRPTEPKTLEEVIFQAVGAASACWEHLDQAGVFQSDRAKQIAEEVVAWINEHVTTKENADLRDSLWDIKFAWLDLDQSEEDVFDTINRECERHGI